MNNIEFVTEIQMSVINNNMAIYKEIFSETSSEEASDLYWKDALTLFSSFDDKQKEILYNIIRQVQVDTVSTMLGIIDGTVFLGNHSPILTLTENRTGNSLNGDLQDLFLEMEENK
jgi:hypothetical protein